MLGIRRPHDAPILGTLVANEMLAAYDLLSMRRIHRATALGGAWVVLIELTANAIGHTATWESFATHMHSLGV